MPKNDTPVDNAPEKEPKIVSKKKTMIKEEFIQTETGLVVPKTTVLTTQDYTAKKYDSDSWAVYAEDGRLVKIYSEKDGTKPEDCERAAKNLANKLSNQFI